MSKTWDSRDPISLLGFSITWAFNPWWGVRANRYREPRLHYTFYLGLGRLRLVLRVHLPWRKP